MKKRVLMIVLSVAVVFSVIMGGCSNSSKSQSSGPIEIGMYHSWVPDSLRGKALLAVVKKFNDQNQGKINVTVTFNPDFPSYQAKIKTMIASNQTPDVFQYGFNPNDLSRQKSGKLLDFTPYMDSSWKARYNADDLKTLTIDGKLTSIPFTKAGALIYYNKALFAQAGITSFPTTWDELFTAFDQLKVKGITPISLYSADDAWHTFNLFTYLAASVGGQDVFKDSLNTPEMEKAADYLKKAFSYTTKDAIGANYSVSVSNFTSKKTAMVIDGPWLMGSLDKSGITNDIGIAPAPTFNNGKVKPGFNVTDALTPLAAGKQTNKAKEEAIVKFMKFISSEDSTKALTLQGSTIVAAKLPSLSESEVKTVGPVFEQYIKVNSAATQSFVNVQRNLTPAANSAIPSLVESLALGKITPQEFVKQLDSQNK